MFMLLVTHRMDTSSTSTCVTEWQKADQYDAARAMNEVTSTWRDRDPESIDLNDFDQRVHELIESAII